MCICSLIVSKNSFSETSQETCIIYGMPKAAVEAGVVDRTVPLPRVADEILAAV